MATIAVLTEKISPDQIPQAGAQVDAEDIKARRAAAHAIFEQGEGSDRTIDLEKLASEEIEATKPKERVESLLIRAPVNGAPAEIEFGPPSGISLSMRLATISGEKNPNRMELYLLRTLMHVRKINGDPVTPINSQVEATFLANMLGDDTLNFLFDTMLETWPPAGKGDLQILSKNLRRP